MTGEVPDVPENPLTWLVGLVRICRRTDSGGLGGIKGPAVALARTIVVGVNLGTENVVHAIRHTEGLVEAKDGDVCVTSPRRIGVVLVLLVVNRVACGVGITTVHRSVHGVG